VKAKSFQFRGPCSACDEEPPVARAGVSFRVERDDSDEWICASCAIQLARKLKRAARDAESREADGQVFRHDRWRKANPK
jgi:hypothetical protein